jgi:hypothetical protein
MIELEDSCRLSRALVGRKHVEGFDEVGGVPKPRSGARCLAWGVSPGMSPHKTRESRGAVTEISHPFFQVTPQHHVCRPLRGLPVRIAPHRYLGLMSQAMNVALLRSFTSRSPSGVIRRTQTAAPLAPTNRRDIRFPVSADEQRVGRP